MSEATLIEKMVCAGTAACTADILTFPFDVAKVRLQLLGEAAASTAITATATANGTIAIQPQFNGLFGTLIHLAKTEGVKSLWGGIVPGLQRQMIFASLRVGFYDNVKEAYASKLPLDESKYSHLMAIRILSGVTTGALAISVAQPTDVVKVKMQARSGPSFPSAAAAYKSIWRTEGLAGLWKGWGPNVLRNSVVNATELVCYDTIKTELINRKLMKDGLLCHFSAAFSAGFCATVVASPIDVVKTRLMNSSGGTYKGFTDCASKLYNEAGFKAFYKGYVLIHYDFDLEQLY